MVTLNAWSMTVLFVLVPKLKVGGTASVQTLACSMVPVALMLPLVVAAFATDVNAAKTENAMSLLRIDEFIMIPFYLKFETTDSNYRNGTGSIYSKS